MKVHQMLTCIFILSLQDGNSGFFNGETILGIEGENITHWCHFFDSGSRKIFCKEECEEKDILVETTGGRNQRGRYSIEYDGGAHPATNMFTFSSLYVSITNLTKSDSGRYTCGSDRDSQDFEIEVVDERFLEYDYYEFISEGEWLSYDDFDFEFISEDATGVQLYVRLTLVIIFIVSSAAVLIFCRRRASKAEDPAVEAEYVNVTEANPVYEEVREDRRSRSPPVGISAGHNLSCSQFAEDSV